MRVTVRLFAGLRERAGRSRLELDDVAGVEDVWPALGLGDEPPGLLYAVNREYVERGQALADGDEVALIPPVSGGSFRLVEGPLDVTAVLREVEPDWMFLTAGLSLIAGKCRGARDNCSRACSR